MENFKQSLKHSIKCSYKKKQSGKFKAARNEYYFHHNLYGILIYMYLYCNIQDQSHEMFGLLCRK